MPRRSRSSSSLETMPDSRQARPTVESLGDRNAASVHHGARGLGVTQRRSKVHHPACALARASLIYGGGGRQAVELAGAPAGLEALLDAARFRRRFRAHGVPESCCISRMALAGARGRQYVRTRTICSGRQMQCGREDGAPWKSINTLAPRARSGWEGSARPSSRRDRAPAGRHSGPILCIRVGPAVRRRRRCALAGRGCLRRRRRTLGGPSGCARRPGRRGGGRRKVLVRRRGPAARGRRPVGALVGSATARHAVRRRRGAGRLRPRCGPVRARCRGAAAGGVPWQPGRECRPRG